MVATPRIRIPVAKPKSLASFGGSPWLRFGLEESTHFLCKCYPGELSLPTPPRASSAANKAPSVPQAPFALSPWRLKRLAHQRFLIGTFCAPGALCALPLASSAPMSQDL